MNGCVSKQHCSGDGQVQPRSCPRWLGAPVAVLYDAGMRATAQRYGGTEERSRMRCALHRLLHTVCLGGTSALESPQNSVRSNEGPCARAGMAGCYGLSKRRRPHCTAETNASLRPCDAIVIVIAATPQATITAAPMAELSVNGRTSLRVRAVQSLRVRRVRAAWPTWPGLHSPFPLTTSAQLRNRRHGSEKSPSPAHSIS